MSVTVHVVPHTHWDREWYHPAAVFHLRLVRLVDDLLDLLARRPDFRCFLLDGQAVVLDDYVGARPERAEELRRLFGEGRLEAGPWYVLADEFLVSPEALIRNLLAGGRTVRRHGGRPMRVGYSPDAFGHPAGLPAVLRGFGLEVAVAWRGLGGVPGQEGDCYRWRAPDGSEVLLVHLPPPGYENGKSLPRERTALAAWWERTRRQLGARARTPHWLVLAGADHHAAQHDLPEVVAELGAIAPSGFRFVISTLEDYAEAVRRSVQESGLELPVLRGDLRAGHAHAWALQGTHGSRLYLKQENAACQRLLERYAEPLAALEAARRAGEGGADRRAELDVAWRALLENHPHDSICGTSADPVHREMRLRFARCAQAADETVGVALEGAIGHDRGAARAAGRDAWHPALLLFNPSPAPRGGIVEAEVALFRRDVSVGQQRASAAPPVMPGVLRLLSADGTEVPHQQLAARAGHDLVESPVHYPVASAVEWRRLAVLAPALPPLGVLALRVAEGAPGASGSAPPGEGRGMAGAPHVQVEANQMGNGRLWMRVEEAGTIELVDLATGEHYGGLGELVDNGDAGDSYTYSAPRPDRVIREPDAVAQRVVHGGPLVGELEIARRYDRIGLETLTRVRLRAPDAHVEITIEGTNARGDHRLRAAFPLGAPPRREVADGLFGPVERTVGEGRAPASPAGMEQPAPTAPMQRYVSAAAGARGLTVLADGLPEYELRPDGTLLVTLLRAFGQLSREDMPERPGHAGWPTPTPEAQCLGPFRARLGVVPHPESELESRAAIERAAESFHAPLLALMRRSLLAMPGPVPGPALSGEGLVFTAMKPAVAGRGTVLRCYNATAGPVRGAWRIPWRVRSAELTGLDEAPLAPLTVASDGTVAFDAAPRAVVTLVIR